MGRSDVGARCTIVGEVDRAEQHHRIEVRVAGPKAEVQHRAVVILAGTARRSRRCRPPPPTRPCAPRIDARNEYEVRRFPACAIDDVARTGHRTRRTTRRPGPAARTVVPGATARSTPRWPAPKRDARRIERRADRGRRPDEPTRLPTSACADVGASTRDDRRRAGRARETGAPSKTSHDRDQHDSGKRRSGKRRSGKR